MSEDSRAELEYRHAQERLFAAISANDARGSVVPMRASYVNAATCLSVIAFPPAAVAGRIGEELIQPLAALEPSHHYYPPPTLHVTIFGLRVAHAPPTFSNDDVAIAADALRGVAGQLRPLQFDLNGVARFPASLVVRAFATTMLRDTAHTLSRAFREAGLVADKLHASDDVFAGAITFCRFTAEPRAELLECAARFRNVSPGRFVATTMQLVSCDEVCSLESMRTHATVRAG
ncbi:MAG: 2'-5' RNA ligase family protein [Steroidobacteraceae bacterium]